MPGTEEIRNRQFQAVVSPHVNAAYNLARCICRNEADCRDVLQESFVRAVQYLGSYQAGDARSWLLAIVRNSAYTWLRTHRRDGNEVRDARTDNTSSDGEGGPSDPMTEAAHQQEIERQGRYCRSLAHSGESSWRNNRTKDLNRRALCFTSCGHCRADAELLGATGHRLRRRVLTHGCCGRWLE